jgi:hypothetical protein
VAGHGADCLDVPEILGHQDDRNRRNQKHCVGVKAGRREFRHSDPRCRGERAEVDWLAPSQSIRQQQIDKIAGDGAEDDGQSSP